MGKYFQGSTISAVGFNSYEFVPKINIIAANFIELFSITQKVNYVALPLLQKIIQVILISGNLMNMVQCLFIACPRLDVIRFARDILNTVYVNRLNFFLIN